MTSVPAPAAVEARTRRVPTEEIADLIGLLPEGAPLSWVRRGEGLVGWGVAAVVRTAGPARFSDAGKWWSELVARSTVVDEVGEPGTGLVAFGSFAFSADATSAESVLVVPRYVAGRRGDHAWVTAVSAPSANTGVGSGPDGGPCPDIDRWGQRVGASGATQSRTGTGPDDGPNGLAPTMQSGRTPHPDLNPGEPVFADGALTSEEWKRVVAAAVGRIQAGELEKVVLARDVVATLPEPLDVRRPLARLASAYPMCWTFHVDGLFGATPELLVRRERGLVTSRVLAGTLPSAMGERGDEDPHDLALAATLSESSKDLEEHEYAVRSVADALEPYCSSMNVPETPFVLHLPNVMHLATDVTGVARDGATSLQLAEALHPSAAVGGTPREAAVALITELEGMDRGRYAGPVGWMDATGDGEWGIALRSAEIVADGRSVRLFAGCGVVGSSDPEAELAESNAKLVPVRESLTSPQG